MAWSKLNAARHQAGLVLRRHEDLRQARLGIVETGEIEVVAVLPSGAAGEHLLIGLA